MFSELSEAQDGLVQMGAMHELTWRVRKVMEERLTQA